MATMRFRTRWSVALAAGASALLGCGTYTDEETERSEPGILDETPGEITQALAGGTFAFALVNHLGEVDFGNRWSSNAPDHPQPAAAVKIGTGRVVVVFRSAGGSGGNVQLVAHNSVGHRCQLVGAQPSNGHEYIEVQCSNHNGTPFDTAFWVQYTRPPALVGNTAYVTLTTPLAVEVPHTPSAHISLNSNGGVNTIVKEATGLFRVNLPTIWTTAPMVQVTAVGTAGEYCKIRSDSKIGTRDLMVKVACYNAIGQPADALSRSTASCTAMSATSARERTVARRCSTHVNTCRQAPGILAPALAAPTAASRPTCRFPIPLAQPAVAPSSTKCASVTSPSRHWLFHT